MTVSSWERVKELLHQAVALQPQARAKFLDEVCAADADLRAELDSLLLADGQLSEEFLRSPLVDDRDGDIEEFGATRLAEGQFFARRFQLIRKLGEGGMGQVWLAEQVAPVRRLVALKLIGAGMYDEAVVQRFQAERQSLAIMEHPYIAKVFDAGTTPQGQPYFVMEFVPGLPITEYCDQKRLNIRDRLEVFIQACEGVQHAHQKAIIHRDLKPANILVVEVDGIAVPRIIDFGLAKAITPKQTDETLFTRFGQFIGTPGYMSPEQVDPNIRDLDTRTDVYALGVILYVLLTGLLPFEAKRLHKPALDVWLRQLREEEPPTMSAKLAADSQRASMAAEARATDRKQLIRILRGDLQWIASKALERERERRYGLPSELAADLRRYLNHEPVAARPASVGYQLRKFIRRNRVAAVVAGMLCILGLAASGAGLIAVRKQHEAEFHAAQALQTQARLLTQAAAERLRDWDLTGAQDIILYVVGNPAFAAAHTPAAISVFQDIRAADLQLTVLSGHEAKVNSAAYSPDGTRIVTASNDKTARVWDVATGAPLSVLAGHDSYLYFAAFSPDGSRVVTASDDRTARVWDARSAAQLVVLSGHDDQVVSAAYSPDGSRIVTASTDKTARIWDARSGVQLTVLSGHAKLVTFAAYSPDGTRIVTTSSDNTARIWDARTGAPVTILAGHGDSVRSAEYSPDGTRIVTASYDKTARIWDARTGRQLAVLFGHGGYVHFAAFSPDGTRIVTASYDKTAGIWDARTAVQLAALAGYEGGFYTAVYSPDGARIVTASRDKTVRIWDASIPAPLSAQILWQASAETDPLPEVDRAELGLPLEYPVRSWPGRISACDQAAAAIYDPDRLAPGKLKAKITSSNENLVCAAEIGGPNHTARADYQMGRALMAEGDHDGARRELEIAVARAYRAARVDLADLLMNDSAAVLGRERAVSLYEQAWQAGVPIAAFKLGYFYEYGAHPDTANAWRWYQRAADTGEPNALARIAERDERNALVEADPRERNEHLLAAFKLYAAAAERARYEDWPGESWSKWRYRRASLARLLAREGMMQQVAEAYAAVRSRWTARPPSLWERVKNGLRR